MSLLKLNNNVIQLKSSLKNGLVSYFDFSNSSVDATGYSTPVDFTSGVTYYNDYVEFNSGYTTIVENGIGKYNFQEYTISGWFNMGTINIQDQSLWSYDFTEWHPQPYDGKLYAQHIRYNSSNNDFRFVTNYYNTIDPTITGHTYTYTNSSTIFEPNKWYFLTSLIKNNGSFSTQKIYINGVLESSTNKQPNILYYNQPVWIGKNTYSVSNNFKVKNVGVWNRALSDIEITKLYNNNNGLKYKNLENVLGIN